MAELQEIKNLTDFKNKLDAAGKNLVVVHFWAPWADQCKQMNEVVEELQKKFSKVHFYKLEAEEIPEISMDFEIEAVPTFVFFKKSKKINRLDGAHAPQLEEMVKKNIDALPPPMSDEEDKKAALNQRIKSLLNSSKCLLFMKGSPTQPKCGFSRQTIEILNKYDCEFSSFDILEDNDIRQGLKEYSNWPTYPQLYIDGELIGGLDIIKEMDEEGELQTTLPKKENLDEKLKSLINKHRVMLFMKGSPDTPKCGFSKQTIEILNNTKVDFGHFDILTDNTVRQGLKAYSNWPTYPQLYVNGELIGGLDIIKEMVEENELVDTLKAD